MQLKEPFSSCAYHTHNQRTHTHASILRECPMRQRTLYILSHWELTNDKQLTISFECVCRTRDRLFPQIVLLHISKKRKGNHPLKRKRSFQQKQDLNGKQ